VEKEVVVAERTIAQRGFVKAERNLEAVGFFSASNNELKKKSEKVIRMRRKVDGRVQDVEITILPSAKWGLPSTVHQDIYRAFQMIVTERIREAGGVPKHISFTSAELLGQMGVSRRNMGGREYKLIEEWLDVMCFTGIKVNAKGGVWDARRKEWITRRVTVFEEVVCCGEELSDGTVADEHHIWLSDWQHANLNEFYLLSLNYDLYKSLERNIAKSLFSLLHSWFYVGDGKYTERYDKLCSFLGLKVHSRASYMRRQLEPAHEELKEKGFLDRWTYRKMRSGGVLITWYAGEQYFEDRARLERLRRAEKRQLEMPLEERKLAKAEGFSKECVALVREFHRKLGRDERQPTDSELEKAAQLIQQHSLEVAEFVRDFAIEEAQKTNFVMRDFGALKLYVDEGVARYRQHTLKQRQQARVQKDEARQLVTHLHRQLGRGAHDATEEELTEAMRMLSRNGLQASMRLVEYAIEDAREMNFEMTHFGEVAEVIDRVTAGQS